MNLSSGDPQPIISNVALGPSALGQHWKLLASAHHLIKPHSHHAQDQDHTYLALNIVKLSILLLNLASHAHCHVREIAKDAGYNIDQDGDDNIDCHVREIAQGAGADQDAVVRCACQALLVPLAMDL